MSLSWDGTDDSADGYDHYLMPPPVRFDDSDDGMGHYLEGRRR